MVKTTLQWFDLPYQQVHFLDDWELFPEEWTLVYHELGHAHVASFLGFPVERLRFYIEYGIVVSGMIRLKDCCKPSFLSDTVISLLGTVVGFFLFFKTWKGFIPGYLFFYEFFWLPRELLEHIFFRTDFWYAGDYWSSGKIGCE